MKRVLSCCYLGWIRRGGWVNVLCYEDRIVYETARLGRGGRGWRYRGFAVVGGIVLLIGFLGESVFG